MDIASPLVALVLGAVAPLAQPAALIGDLLRAPTTFQQSERAVGNWRIEAARQLAIDGSTAAALLGGREPKGLGRCVKLNNYWCIKGVGWNGMVAADAEGHAAFSSATEGAAVAALLLRRYYLEFSRRSANAIVSRWAPPQCGMPAMAGKAFGIAQRRASLGPEPKKRADDLTTRGIGNTLRAHYLAARRAGGRVAARRGLRRSVVQDRVATLIRAPTISSGYGEPVIALSALRLASLAAPMTMPSVPVFSCALDGQRLRNYAMKAIDGVAASPDDDLKLFEPDGSPNPALSRLMENMSSVEIGPLKADPALVQAGIAAATAAMRAAREAAPDLRPAIASEAAR